MPVVSLPGVVAHRAVNLDVGYATTNVLVTAVEPSGDAYKTRAERNAFYRSIADALAARPAVDSVLLRAHVSQMGGDGGRFEIGASRRAFTNESPSTYVEVVQGSLGAIGITLRGGRAFDTRDVDGGERVALVSASLAASHWPGRSPVGEQIRLAVPSDSAQSRTIVGVVSDVLLGDPFSPNRSSDAVYVPFGQLDVPRTQIFFRHRGDVRQRLQSRFACSR